MTAIRTGRAVGVSAFALLAACMLAACGSSGSSSGTTTAAAATGQPGAGVNDAQLTKIRECLAAAGISMPTPSAGQGTRPSGASSGRPSGEAGTPGAMPTGAPPGAGSGAPGEGLFSDTKVVAALTACGITVPTAGPVGGPSAAPTGSPTS